eukprot:PLAT11594.50.p1 GENE.PLAT11594.50~~PLAT11594.50.p1  ORF type:complete len:1102 (-),score=560.66 PLAT11594.50:249-3290(-)
MGDDCATPVPVPDPECTDELAAMSAACGGSSPTTCTDACLEAVETLQSCGENTASTDELTLIADEIVPAARDICAVCDGEKAAATTSCRADVLTAEPASCSASCYENVRALLTCSASIGRPEPNVETWLSFCSLANRDCLLRWLDDDGTTGLGACPATGSRCPRACQSAFSSLYRFCNEDEAFDTRPQLVARARALTCQWSANFYDWRTTYDECSVTCGGGEQLATHTCYDIDDNVVDAPFCGNAPPSTRVCNLQACETFTWQLTGYEECNRPCGGGLASPIVDCVSSYTGVTDASACADVPMPQPLGCNTQSCPSFFWISSDWSDCSESCGGGERTRVATCMQDVDGTESVADSANCEADERPAESEVCNDQPCITYSWRAGDWRECTGCGPDSSRRRSVRCIDSLGRPAQSQQCVAADRPMAVERGCGEPCPPYAWQTGPWLPCDALCGGGVAARDLSCTDVTASELRGQDIIVDDDFCAGLTPPAASRECNTQLCPIALWVIDGDWSACSEECGGGVSTLPVRCTVDGADREDAACAAIQPAFETERACNTQPCDPCDDVTCKNGGECDGGACTCLVGFSGELCEVDERSAEPPCNGSLVLGDCCELPNTPDAADGCCSVSDLDGCGICGGTGALQPDGECCESGVISPVDGCCAAGQSLDAVCGLCVDAATDNTPRAIDQNGECCEGTLQAGGECCPLPYEQDDCGICQGSNACKLQVNSFVQALLSPGQDGTVVSGVVTNALQQALNIDFNRLNATSEFVETEVHNSRRRRLLQDFVPLETSVSIAYADGADMASVQEQAVAQMVDDESEFADASSDSLAVDSESVSGALAGDCGNQLCEVGEDSSNCPSDCPVLRDCAGGGVCSGHGRCNRLTGQCTCNTGWAGDGCSGCEATLELRGGVCTTPLAEQLAQLRRRAAEAVPDAPTREDEGTAGPLAAVQTLLRSQTAAAIAGVLLFVLLVAFVVWRYRVRKAGKKAPRTHKGVGQLVSMSHMPVISTQMRAVRPTRT